jgi:hypothetical protein
MRRCRSGRKRALLPVSNSSLKPRCQKLSITRWGRIFGIYYDRFVDDLTSLPGRALLKNRASWSRGSRKLGSSFIASARNAPPLVHRRYPHVAAATGTCPPIILDNIRRFEQGLSLLRHIDAAQGCRRI